jgi:iron complex outermembrane receptor protein
LEGTPSPVHLVLPAVVRSYISGNTDGVEVSATGKISKAWKLTGGYTLFQIHLRPAPPSQDTSTAGEEEGSSPRHQFLIRSMLNLSRTVQLDSAVYYVGRLPGPSVPQYTRLDVRLGWRPNRNFEVSAGGQNLLDPRHFEFGSGDLVSATQVRRNVYAMLTFRY